MVRPNILRKILYGKEILMFGSVKHFTKNKILFLRKTNSGVWFVDHFTENDIESDPKNCPSMNEVLEELENEVLEELEKINAIKEKVAEPKHNPKPNKRKEDRHQHHHNYHKSPIHQKHGVNRAGARA